MPPQDRSQRHPLWSRTSVFGALLAFCFAIVGYMGLQVLREIDALSTANSDNLQWSLSQADVEFLRFRLAIEEAEQDPDMLPTVRRRFDVFYSRFTTLESGMVFRDLRADPAFNGPRSAVRAFLDETIPLIDGDPAALQAALPALQQRSLALSEAVRALSLAGLTSFAALSDQRRQEVMDTLLKVSAVLVLLLAGLGLLALSFRRLYRLAETRARDVRQTGARMQTVVETSADAIVVTDAKGRIVDLNQAAIRLFGHSRDEMLGSYPIELFSPKELRPALREKAIDFMAEGGRPAPAQRRFETDAIAKNGRRFPVEISMDRARHDASHHYVAFVRDISHRKQAEARLRAARDKALTGERAKAQFLAVMSHEMRTPLNGLLGTMQLMRDRPLDEKQRSLLDHMQSSGRLLLGLVNDVLDLAKFESGTLTPEKGRFDPTRLLDLVVESTASLAAANGNAVSWAWIGAAEPMLRGDARRVRQVLLNLVGNAVKFTRGGTVDIEIERLEQDAMLEIRVIDSGVGIAEADLHRVFEDFETVDSSYARKAGGTGLGLGITRRLVDLLGGEIGVESEIGVGSLFWVRLPLPSAPDAPDKTAPETTPRLAHRAARPLSILLVEDNEINRFVAREMLEAAGHRVTEAVDGRAGVEWANAQAFDAILMDISMPVMDGQDAARAIRSGNGPSAKAPIIAVTAHALPDEIAAFRDAGMELCISKPIDRVALMNALGGDTALAGTESGVEMAGGQVDPGLMDEGLIDEGLIDVDQLQTLADTLAPAALAKLMDRLCDDLDAAIAGLARSARETAGVQADAHKAAGSCAAFGLTALRTALITVEAQAKTGAVQPASLTALGPLWAATRAALRDWAAQRA